MKTHLNTLFVTLEGAYLRKDGAAIEIRHEGETKLRVPLHNLDGIACFGWDTEDGESQCHEQRNPTMSSERLDTPKAQGCCAAQP